jgi:SAM-dependent methyltransferase
LSDTLWSTYDGLAWTNISRTLAATRSSVGKRACVVIAVVAAIAVVAMVSPASTKDLPYLAAPGAPANAFPKVERPVADIVSPSRSSEEKRDANNESGQLARFLGLKQGMTVADIGAGSGYHTVRLSRLLGPSGRVIAQDVTPNYLADLTRRVDRLNLQNVRFALGEPHDPRLPPGSLDAAILVHMYHEIAQPYAFLYNLAPALKPGATIGIVDLDKPITKHGTPPDLLRCELAAVGYRETGFHKLTGDAGYLAIFSPPKKGDRTPPEAVVPCRVGVLGR